MSQSSVSSSAGPSASSNNLEEIVKTFQTFIQTLLAKVNSEEAKVDKAFLLSKGQTFAKHFYQLEHGLLLNKGDELTEAEVQLEIAALEAELREKNQLIRKIKDSFARWTDELSLNED